MDDSTIAASQMPEVVWDCGSPSPSTWKNYQVPLTMSGEKSEMAKPTTMWQHPKLPKKSKKVFFQIDSKCIEHAKTIIDQLKTVHNGVAETQTLGNSFEKIFEQSGNHEDLACTPILSYPVANGLGGNIDIPEDFWDEDIFDEAVVQGLNYTENKTPKSLQVPQKSGTTTSTPFSVKTRSRYEVNKNVSEKNSSKENDCVVNKDDSLNGIAPLDCTTSTVAQDTSTSIDLLNIDACAEFFMSYSVPSQRKSLGRKRSLKVVTPTRKPTILNENNTSNRMKGVKLSLPTESNADCPKANDNIVSKKQIANKSCLVNDKSLLNSVTAENSPRTNVSISNEILSQLINDDSWSDTCTANARQMTGKASKDSLFKADPHLNNMLSNLETDGKWTYNQPSKSNETAALRSHGIFNRNQDLLSVDKANCANGKLLTSPCKLFVQNDPCPVSASSCDSFTVSCDNLTPPATIPVSPQAPRIGSIPQYTSDQSNTKYTFKSTSTPMLSSCRMSLPHTQKCTAAEIEEKRLKALQRKRLKQKK